MKPVFDDLRKAEKFLKALEGKSETRQVAELSNLLFQERVNAKALANAEVGLLIHDTVRRLIAHLSVDELEIIINHSGKGIRLLRETGKKKG